MTHFIEDFWIKNSHLWNGALVTRFPPEPNGRLHLGHARSIWLNAMLSKAYGGAMHLRMDDTNPEKEDVSHEHAIKDTLNRLNVPWKGDVRYASDNFSLLFEAAEMLIGKGLAYVDTTDKETMRSMRGDLYRPGTRSSDAEKVTAWHLDMFRRMRAGEFAEGVAVLRAKIDMASPNINLRDPVIYRIKHVAHARTGNTWCIYPTYDFAHPFCDVVEGISLSLCTLEFEDHRPFYDWVCEHCASYAPAGTVHKPVELEFSRLEIAGGMTSKRKINALVETGAVDDYSDPRLLTLDALFRRGFTTDCIFAFIEASGISRSNSTLEFSRLEEFTRLTLDPVALRRVVIKDPVAVDVEGGEFDVADATANNHPKDESMGVRSFYRSRSLWMERDDVRTLGMAEKGFKRMEVGAVVRFMNIGIVRCLAIEHTEGVVTRVVVEPSSEKPRATLHALSRKHATPVTVVMPYVLGPEDEVVPMVEHRAMMEPDVLSLNATFHAIRVGYMRKDVECPTRLIMTTELKKSF